MELSVQEQIFEHLGKAKRVLIALPQQLNADSAASALALARFLRKQGKEAEVASSGMLPAVLDFLPEAGTFKQSLASGKSLVLVVDTSAKELDEISYQTTDTNVSIYLKPKAGEFVPQDISFVQEKAPFDLVIIMDAVSLEDLGKLFEDNTEVFFNTPKINIDNHAANEYFGAINFVDINATSIAEMLTALLLQREAQILDEDIATCLLTGIIAKTNSFQHVQTTPNAFLKASELIALGARQQEIVKYLFKTKSLPLLRLWGRALARLKIVGDSSAVFSLLSLADFEKASAASGELRAVLKELLDNISGYKIVVLAGEIAGGGLKLLCALHPQIKPEDFFRLTGKKTQAEPTPLGPYKIVEADLPDISVSEAESKILDIIRQLQPKNLPAAAAE